MTRKSEFPILASLALIAAATHAFLVPLGLALSAHDWANFLLIADDFRHGIFSAFPYQQTYGGLTLPAIRGLFAGAWSLLRPAGFDFVRSQMVFSFVLCPIAMAWSSFYLVRAYCSRAAAVAVGVLAAVGFQHWVINYGNDFYVLSIVLGTILLVLRARIKENALRELRPATLFAAGLVSGQILYNMPAGLPYILALFVPVRASWQELKSLFRKGSDSPVNRWLIRLALALFALFAYIEVFGRQLGAIGGRVVKADSLPNFWAGTGLLAVVWLRRKLKVGEFRKRLPNDLKRMAFVLAGFFLGLLPKLVYVALGRGAGFRAQPLFVNDLRLTAQIAAKVPFSIRELFTGDARLLAGATLALVCLGLFELARKSRTSSKTLAVALAMCFSVACYCRLRTDSTPIAPARHLFPIFLPMLVALGLAWDRLWSLRGVKPLGQALAVLLLVLHCTDHLLARKDLASGLRQSHLVGNIHRLIEVYQKNGIHAVLSDDLGQCNAYTLASNRSVVFWPAESRWGLPKAERLSRELHKLGILLTRPLSAGQHEITLANRTWKLTPLGSVGEFSLYSGVDYPGAEVKGRTALP